MSSHYECKNPFILELIIFLIINQLICSLNFLFLFVSLDRLTSASVVRQPSDRRADPNSSLNTTSQSTHAITNDLNITHSIDNDTSVPDVDNENQDW